MNNEIQNKDFILPGGLGTINIGGEEKEVVQISSDFRKGTLTITLSPQITQNPIGIKWKIVTPDDRLTELMHDARVSNMTVEEYLSEEQWESVEHYINFKPGLGWQPS
jgi:hypothetical protein